MASFKLKKGLNINLNGAPEAKVVSVQEDKNVALVPDDFVGVTPKVVVKVGDAVKAGS
ncbi:MAG: NADH:ubiquinone reductase (Na(+)-transporting) subunit A, partial [Bacteroidales bacterium]|nr:NADH:ubiquinone reductase (Na(+)-transporting) subunit A [Bacteroidales bacterium]